MSFLEVEIKSYFRVEEVDLKFGTFWTTELRRCTVEGEEVPRSGR